MVGPTRLSTAAVWLYGMANGGMNPEKACISIRIFSPTSAQACAAMPEGPSMVMFSAWATEKISGSNADISALEIKSVSLKSMAGKERRLPNRAGITADHRYRRPA